MIAGIRWQILVDWANAGTWDADGSDVSADVLGLRWWWGRRGLPVPEFAPPAELEITLRNHDHRYTPGNSSGPLGANVRPGRPVWLRANRIHDDFAVGGAASVDLDGRTASAGERWEVTGVAGNGFVVANGTAMGQGRGWPPSDAVALLDTSDPLATLTAHYRRGSNGLGGFALRCAARDDCLRLRFASDATILEQVSGRTVTRLSDGGALETGAWYDLEIEQTADSVHVHRRRTGPTGRETAGNPGGYCHRRRAGLGPARPVARFSQRAGPLESVRRGAQPVQRTHNRREPGLRGRRVSRHRRRPDAAAGHRTPASRIGRRPDALRQRGGGDPGLGRPGSRATMRWTTGGRC